MKKKIKTTNSKLSRNKKATNSKAKKTLKKKLSLRNGSAKKSRTTASKKTKKNSPKSIIYKPLSNPAQAPGHRKLNILQNFPEHNGEKVHLQESAVNAMANADTMKRKNSKNRKIITGAAVGKTGRIIIK